MLTLKFSGNFECLLSTDTDPPDETRGVSGYSQVMPGEPGMDRIIRFWSSRIKRTRCPQLGVTVKKVTLHGATLLHHPLLGAKVDLLNEPKFEGRNGLIAEDGYEPIVPFDIEVTQGDFRLRRPHLDQIEFWRKGDEHPYQLLRASGVNISPGEIAEETGIQNMKDVWKQRALDLQADLATATDETQETLIKGRLRRLEEVGLLRFFGARMLYSIGLAGTPEYSDPKSVVPTPALLDKPWSVELWFGAWDPDAFQGYVKGYLHLPVAQEKAEAAPTMMSKEDGKRPELAPKLR